MADAAKKAGNECTLNKNHNWGMDFYSLAFFMDRYNVAALSNRANSFLLVSLSAALGMPGQKHVRRCWAQSVLRTLPPLKGSTQWCCHL